MIVEPVGSVATSALSGQVDLADTRGRDREMALSAEGRFPPPVPVAGPALVRCEARAVGLIAFGGITLDRGRPERGKLVAPGLDHREQQVAERIIGTGGYR